MHAQRYIQNIYVLHATLSKPNARKTRFHSVVICNRLYFDIFFLNKTCDFTNLRKPMSDSKTIAAITLACEMG